MNIWPPSPKAPARERAPRAKEKEEDERRRKRRRHRSPSRRSRSKSVRQASPSRNHHQDDEDNTATARKAKEKEEDEKRRKRRRHRSPSRRSRSMSVQQASPSRNHHQDDEGNTATAISPPLSENQDSNDDEDDDIGPQPMQKIGGKKIDERSYGGALLRGEGSAMAAFLQDGIESRIPRRGEIGLTSDQIAQYEDVGYVMSGSRHRRMNAVRMRKENQVISAEEKRGILKLQRDERERREAILREEFSELVNERLKGSTSASEPRPK